MQIFRKFFIIVVACTSQLAWAQNTAVIDMAKVFNELDLQQKIEKVARSNNSDQIAKYDKMMSDLQALSKQYETDKKMMSEAKQKEIMREIESKKFDINALSKDLNRDMQVSFAKARDVEFQKIQVVAQKVAKDMKFDVVFQRTAIVFYDQKLDISNQVIKQLSKASRPTQ